MMPMLVSKTTDVCRDVRTIIMCTNSDIQNQIIVKCLYT